MISQLKDIIPGAEHWPQFKRNRSEQFEARYANVEVLESPSIFFKGMEGSFLPIPVAHGEGRADFSATGDFEKCLTGNLISARYIDFNGEPTETYPANPNGSPAGTPAFTTIDGRATIMISALSIREPSTTSSVEAITVKTCSLTKDRPRL